MQKKVSSFIINHKSLRGKKHRPQFSQSSNPDTTSVSNDSINLSLSSRTRRQEGKKSAGPASRPLFNPHPISEQQEAASGRWRREARGARRSGVSRRLLRKLGALTKTPRPSTKWKRRMQWQRTNVLNPLNVPIHPINDT